MSNQTASIIQFPTEVPPPESLVPTVDEILGLVCEYYGVTRRDIASQRRDRNTSFIRHMIMYLCAKHTLCSHSEIGRNLGGFDSTSIIHGRRRIVRDMREDDFIAVDVAAIEAKLGGRCA